MVLAGDSLAVCILKCSQAFWLALAWALELSVSGRELTAADVPGTLPHMNCESYTAEDRCASFVFFFKSQYRDITLAGRKQHSFYKVSLYYKSIQGRFWLWSQLWWSNWHMTSSTPSWQPWNCTQYMGPLFAGFGQRQTKTATCLMAFVLKKRSSWDECDNYTGFWSGDNSLPQDKIWSPSRMLWSHWAEILLSWDFAEPRGRAQSLGQARGLNLWAWPWRTRSCIEQDTGSWAVDWLLMLRASDSKSYPQKQLLCDGDTEGEVG